MQGHRKAYALFSKVNAKMTNERDLPSYKVKSYEMSSNTIGLVDFR